jgi:hypothetical protein
MTIAIIAHIVVMVALTGFIVLGLCNKWLPKWACSKLDWHLAPRIQGFDGCSMSGKCPRCGKDVLMDSQGNWF